LSTGYLRMCGAMHYRSPSGA